MLAIDDFKKQHFISLIAALSLRTRVIGKNGELLWHIPDDLQRFKKITSGHPVIMGRKTWESLPKKFRPLIARTNIIVTRNSEYTAVGAQVCQSFTKALKKARNAQGAEEIFIIGGGELYALAFPYAKRLYLTLVDSEKDGDTFFPPYESEFTKVRREEDHDWNGLHYQWIELERDI